MIYKKSIRLMSLLFLVFTLPLSQFNFAIADEIIKPTPKLQEAVKNLFNGAKIESITTSPVKGLYQIIVAQGVYYITESGKHLISGELFETANKLNLTENARKSVRKDLLLSVDKKDMIVFSPEKVKHSVTVFTDIDCGYCRKLHSEIKTYLDKGIEVKYMAFPRAGIMSPGYNKTVSIWCAKEKKKVFTDAKLGKTVPVLTCDNPVAKEYNLGLKIGLQGTPAILLDDGTLLPGYLSANKLEKEINSIQSRI